MKQFQLPTYQEGFSVPFFFKDIIHWFHPSPFPPGIKLTSINKVLPGWVDGYYKQRMKKAYNFWDWDVSFETQILHKNPKTKETTSPKCQRHWSATKHNYLSCRRWCASFSDVNVIRYECSVCMCLRTDNNKTMNKTWQQIRCKWTVRSCQDEINLLFQGTRAFVSPCFWFR